MPFVMNHKTKDTITESSNLLTYSISLQRQHSQQQDVSNSVIFPKLKLNRKLFQERETNRRKNVTLAVGGGGGK
jgi:hypothetical protein